MARRSCSAVARRLGMTREGVLREAAPLHGVRHDIELWAVLASEWAQVESDRSALSASAL